MNNEQIQQLADLVAFKKSLESSHAIPLSIDQSFRARFGGVKDYIISGRVLQVAGVGRVVDPRITAASTIVVTSYAATTVAYQASTATGVATIISADGSSKVINYVIVI